MFNSPLRNIVLCGIEIGIGTPTSTIESNIYTTHVAIVGTWIGVYWHLMLFGCAHRARGSEECILFDIWLYLFFSCF